MIQELVPKRPQGTALATYLSEEAADVCSAALPVALRMCPVPTHVPKYLGTSSVVNGFQPPDGAGFDTVIGWRL